MCWARVERMKRDDPDGAPVEAPSATRVERNLARIPLAALGRA